MQLNLTSLFAIFAKPSAGRAVEPFEVAKLYLFLASEDATMVSGSNYRMDGGMVLH
jgi:NAD(P)-dependent dehydrogenase (short-subunit alcohol dehydrogenase family)